MISTLKTSPAVEFSPPGQTLPAFFFTESNLPVKPARGRLSTAIAQSFRLVEHAAGDRSEIEHFISQRFADCFGSKVEAFMPRLFSLRNQDGAICGAFGLRSASRRLFLEQYLDLPIEKELAACAAGTFSRQSIIEVGHFSGTFPGSVRAMIKLLTERLHHEGFEWVTFTGTASLRNAFSRLGLAPIDIQAADASRLPVEERAAWGSYYQHQPRVLVGNVQEGHRAMSAMSAKRAHNDFDTLEHNA